MSALAPTTTVTEIPGRFCPAYVSYKGNPTNHPTDTGTTLNAMMLLPRCETIDATFNTPVTTIDELGTDFHVGSYDDLPDSKVTITAYDAGYTVLEAITGKPAASNAVTTWGFQDFNNANVDLIRQYADPNGNVFASSLQTGLVIDEFGFSLKQKSVAMESYTLSGFNMLKFKGYIQTKVFNVVSAGLLGDGVHYGLPLSGVMGTDELPIELPQPSGSAPPTYWAQNGHMYFARILRYNHTSGVWQDYTEITGSGQPAPGQAHWDSVHTQINLAQGDVSVGDAWYLTYCTYKTDATSVGGSTANYKTIYATTPDTTDAIAVPTRLTPFTIASNNIPRGQSLDVKMALKRERAEGIGDTSGLYGPAAAPDVSVSFETKATDFGLYAILETGSPLGTDDGGTVAGDFYDPNAATRFQIQTPMALTASIGDPRYASATLKVYTLPSIVLGNGDGSTTTKNAMTLKYSGIDQTGNLTVTVDRTQSPY